LVLRDHVTIDDPSSELEAGFGLATACLFELLFGSVHRASELIDLRGGADLPSLPTCKVGDTQLAAQQAAVSLRSHPYRPRLGGAAFTLRTYPRGLRHLPGLHGVAKRGRGVVGLALSVLEERLERILRARHGSVGAGSVPRTRRSGPTFTRPER